MRKRSTAAPGAAMLRRYIKAAHLSPAKFAPEVGADRQQVYRWLSGARRPSLELAVSIAEVTGGAVPVESWVSTRAA